jgi:hypothetical protein
VRATGSTAAASWSTRSSASRTSSRPLRQRRLLVRAWDASWHLRGAADPGDDRSIALGLALLLDSFIVRRPDAVPALAFFLPYAVPGIIAAMMWLYLYTPEVSPFLPFLPEGTDFMAPGRSSSRWRT